MARIFLFLILFPLCSGPLLGGLVMFCGEPGVIAAIALVYAAGVTLAFYPAALARSGRYEGEALVVCCLVMLGLVTVHCTVSSIGVENFSDFVERAGFFHNLYLACSGGTLWMASAGLLYSALLNFVPHRRRWAQLVSLALFSTASLLAIRDTSGLMSWEIAKISNTPFKDLNLIGALADSPYDLLAWFFLFLILIYKINVRCILEKKASQQANA